MSSSFNWNLYVIIRLSWNLVRLLITWSRSWLTIFDFRPCSREITDIFPILNKSLTMPLFIFFIFFVRDCWAGSFKLCMIMTLIEVYIFMVGLMTSTFLHGHRCVRIINCKLCILDSCLDFCPQYFKCCMVATFITKIVHNMGCVQGRSFTCFLLVKSRACRKLRHLDFLRHHKCNEWQTLHDGTTH